MLGNAAEHEGFFLSFMFLWYCKHAYNFLPSIKFPAAQRNPIQKTWLTTNATLDSFCLSGNFQELGRGLKVEFYAQSNYPPLSSFEKARHFSVAVIEIANLLHIPLTEAICKSRFLFCPLAFTISKQFVFHDFEI